VGKRKETDEHSLYGNRKEKNHFGFVKRASQEKLDCCCKKEKGVNLEKLEKTSGRLTAKRKKEYEGTLWEKRSGRVSEARARKERREGKKTTRSKKPVGG